MASGGLGGLTVDLLLNTTEWASGWGKAEYQAAKTAEAMEKTFSKMGSAIVTRMAALGGAIAGGQLFGQMVEEVGQAEVAAMRLDVTLRNLGGQTSITAARVNELADALARTTSFDGDDVVAAAANLLKFGNVAADVFDKAIIGAADFAAATGQDLPAAMDQLGKAIISPTQAMSRLERQVGYFDEATKNSIKSMEEQGNLIGAQELLLEKLTERTKGTAEAYRNTLPGAIAASKVAFGDFLEMLGKGSGATDFMTASLNNLTDRFRTFQQIFKESGFVDAFNAFQQGVVLPKIPAVAGAEDTAARLKQAEKEAKKFADAIAKQDADLTAVALANTKKRVDAAVKAAEVKAKAFSDYAKHREDLRQQVLQAEVDAINAEIEAEEKAAADKIKIMEYLADYELQVQNEIGQAVLKLERDQMAAWEKEWGAFYKNIESAGRDVFDSFFDDTGSGWDGMLDNMKDSFKRILMDYIYQVTMKPIMLNLAASITGQPGAGGGGTGGIDFGSIARWFADDNTSFMDFFNSSSQTSTGLNIAGGGFSDLSWTSNAGGWQGGVMSAGAGFAGGAFGGWASGALGAGERGQAAAQSYASLGATIGMQVYGPIGAAVGALIGTIAGVATDPDPDAMRSATWSQGNIPGESWRASSQFGEFGFSNVQWGSEADMGETIRTFLAGITDMDNALARFMSPEQITSIQGKLDAYAREYELGMEHTGVTSLATIIQDRLEIITSEIDEGLSAFVGAFEGNIEDLITVVDAYLAATEGAAGFDIDAIIESMQPRSMMEVYQSQSGALQEFIGNMDLSAESMGLLVQGMYAFQQSTIEMVLAIDSASAAMHDMFMSTSEQITRDLLSPEDLYARIQGQTDDLYAQLMGETDPATIQALAEKINNNINEAWGMLDEGQQSALGEAYLERIAELDRLVAEKMAALRDVVVEDADTVMESITDRLDVLFAGAAATAATNAAAANTNLVAAQTPVRVVVDVEQVVVNDGGGG